MNRLIPFLAAFVLLSGCLPENHKWHQKLTLVVETPNGEVTGSSVVEVRVAFYDPPQIGGTEVDYDVTGEATVVEIAPGKYLFALLGGSEERFFAATKDRFTDMTRGEWLREIPKQTEPAKLTGELIPILLTFADISDPMSLKSVDPNDLAAIFGPGVTLKAVTLEITGEPVTEGRVEAVLGWLKNLDDYRTDPANPFTSTLPPEIGYLRSWP